MNFVVLPPEINSLQVIDGPGSGPLLEAAAAWEGIGSELTSAASAFSSVTSDLAGVTWLGPASTSMTNAVAPYVGWLQTAAAQAGKSATHARSAATAYEAALATIVHPDLVTLNRSQLVSLVRSNLFGQNAPSIAAAEAAYEEMWAHDVAVLSGYHADVSAAVSKLTAWEQPLQNLAGLSGQSPAKAFASAASFIPQNIRQNPIVNYILGSPASQPVPATQNPVFVGTQSVATRIEADAIFAVKNFVIVSGIQNQLSNPNSFLLQLFASNVPPLKFFIGNTPPKILTFLLGETVQTTTLDGMEVVQITPAHPSGDYVVAIHGGAFIFPPSIFHWLNYTWMAHQTGATIEVPIYPLLQQGGTAGVVTPEMAGIIETEIGLHGASNVSVIGDSAGGTLALSSAEYLAAHNEIEPASMVLLSPWLDVSLTNPNIAFVHDPLLPIAPGQQIGKEWAGNLAENDYEVSPLYGSLKGLPPTYVYSGSMDSLAPDTVLLDQKAFAEGAPFSFVLRNGEFHDWILLSPDGVGYPPQIYQELGLTGS